MAVELHVVTPGGEAFEGAVDYVVLPGVEGDFGVLQGHEPFLTALRTGGLELSTGGQKRFAAVSSGFAEIHGDAVTVMVGTCEWADEIDADRAERARERLERALRGFRQTPEGEAEYQQLEDAYSRALTRLATSRRIKH
jgi:F-type H+-transporting ATPase subunit epsilon